MFSFSNGKMKNFNSKYFLKSSITLTHFTRYNDTISILLDFSSTFHILFA